MIYLCLIIEGGERKNVSYLQFLFCFFWLSALQVVSAGGTNPLSQSNTEHQHGNKFVPKETRIHIYV